MTKKILTILCLATLAGCAHGRVEEVEMSRRPASTNAPAITAGCAQNEWDASWWLDFTVNERKYKMEFARGAKGKYHCETQQAHLIAADARFPVTVCACLPSQLDEAVAMNCLEVEDDGSIRAKVDGLAFGATDGSLQNCAKESLKQR